MATPAEVVAEQFAQAHNYVSEALESMTDFTNALNSTIYSPPTLSVTWNSIAAPTLPTMPTAPTMPTIEFTAPTAPDEFAEAAPTIDIDDFTEVEPSLDLPAAPEVSYGSVPSIPSVASVTVPDAPTITLPDEPTYLTLTTPTFSGIDLHSDYLTRFDDIPALDLAEPTPYSYAPGPEYASALLTALKAKLLERMSGGTGLDPSVEQAIWDRARSRETQIALANEAEIMRASEALGFQLPSGVLAAQLRAAQQDYYDKLSTLSRDVMIKQAEMEQDNLKTTIQQGMELEGKLIDYSYNMERLAFEAAKQYADNAIQIYNAQVEQFKALLVAYETYARAYDAIIKAELAKVDVYKAELAGEQAKADINRALVEQYKATIDAGLSQVKIYEAQVSGAQTLIQLERTKIEAAAEQVRGFVAQVNAETAKVEAYKAAVQGEQTKVSIYEAKARVFQAKTGAQAEKSRALISRYTALAQAKAAEWDGYKATVNAEAERIRALGAQSQALLDGFKAEASAVESEAAMHTKIWETEIKNYEAGQQVAIQTAKLNGDFAIAANNAALDAAKVGAQVYTQWASSALSRVSVSAGVSAAGNNSVSYSYSNDTENQPPGVELI